jgi:hypothetical protein
MQNDKAKAVKLTPADMAVVDAVRHKLGLRSVSEVLRMGLRALAREQGLEGKYEAQPTSTAWTKSPRDASTSEGTTEPTGVIRYEPT